MNKGLPERIGIANDTAPVSLGLHGALKWMQRDFRRIACGHLTPYGALVNMKDRVWLRLRRI